MTHVDIKQAGEQFMELMEHVASGNEIIIDKDQKPFAKVVPLKRKPQQRQFGSAQGMIVIADLSMILSRISVQVRSNKGSDPEKRRE